MMRIAGLALTAALLVSPAIAQEIEVAPLDDLNIIDPIEELPSVSNLHVTVSDDGVVMRALDKVSGEVTDFELTPDQTKQLGHILVTLRECRYPTLNPSGDAYAFVEVRNANDPAPVFRRWMIASSPALSALDHPRYDVWPMRCITSDGS